MDGVRGSKMEMKDRRRRLEIEPNGDVVMNMVGCDVNLVQSTSTNHSFNNRGKGKQSFDNSDIIGSSRHQRLHHEQDYTIIPRRRTSEHRSDLESSTNNMILDHPFHHDTEIDYPPQTRVTSHAYGPIPYGWARHGPVSSTLNGWVGHGPVSSALKGRPGYGPVPFAPSGHPYLPFSPLDYDSDDVEEHVHLYYERSCQYLVTVVQGLKQSCYGYRRIFHDLQTEFYCYGYACYNHKVIKLCGDYIDGVLTFLVRNGLVKREHVKLHRTIYPYTFC